MTQKINFSRQFMQKYLDSTFQDITKRGWLLSSYYYMIDSQNRTKSQLNKFIHNQLTEPDEELCRMADDFLKRYPKPDLRIVAILRYINKKIKYATDRENFGKVEYWATASETWRRKVADCDDTNGLIYILARLSGIHPLQIWNAIGTVSVGGHYWLIYFSMKMDKWYAIDGTFNTDIRPLSLRNPFRFRTTTYNKIWYVFNDIYSYKQI